MNLELINSIGFSIFATYSFLTLWKFGKIKSYSDSDRKYTGWLIGFFELMLIVAGVTFILNGFWSGVFSFGIAIFSRITIPWIKTIHMIFAVSLFVGVAVEYCLHGLWWWALVMGVSTGLLYLLKRKDKNILTYVEQCLITLAFIGLSFN